MSISILRTTLFRTVDGLSARPRACKLGRVSGVQIPFSANESLSPRTLPPRRHHDDCIQNRREESIQPDEDKSIDVPEPSPRSGLAAILVKVDPVNQLVGQQGSELQKKAPVRPSGGLRGAGRSGRYVWPTIGRGAGGIGRRWSVSGNVDTSTTGECRDEYQRAKDVFQVDTHSTLILANQPMSLRLSRVR